MEAEPMRNLRKDVHQFIPFKLYRLRFDEYVLGAADKQQNFWRIEEGGENFVVFLKICKGILSLFTFWWEHLKMEKGMFLIHQILYFHITIIEMNDTKLIFRFRAPLGIHHVYWVVSVHHIDLPSK